MASLPFQNFISQSVAASLREILEVLDAPRTLVTGASSDGLFELLPVPWTRGQVCIARSSNAMGLI